MAAASTPVNLSEFEAVARARMEPSAFDCNAWDSGDERTRAENYLALDRPALRPRVLVDLGAVSLWTTLSKILRAELELAMGLAGCPSVAAVDRSLIAFRPMR